MVRQICFSENAATYPGMVARNMAVLEYEKFVHGTFYPHVIHPYSRFRVNWDKAFLGLILVRFSVVFNITAIVPAFSICHHGVLLIFHLGNFVDVLVNFFTGYVDSETETAVLDPRKISKHYLLGYFFVDFLPVAPLEFLLGMPSDVSCDDRLAASQHSNVRYTWCRGLVLLRLFAFFRYSWKLGKIHLWNPFLLGMVWVIVGIYSVIIFVNNFYLSNYLHLRENELFMLLKNKTTVENRLAAFCDSITDLLTDCLFFHNDLISQNASTSIFTFVLALFSNVLFMAYYINYTLLRMKAPEKFFDFESKIMSVFKKRHVYSLIPQKTLLYFQVLLDDNYWREDKVFDYIPQTFRSEIFFHRCFPLLRNFHPFENLPKYVSIRLAESMKYQLYLPNEVVLEKNEPSLSMYFVQNGTVALYSSKNVELYHFEGGSTFNGRNLLMGEALASNYAISIEVTEIYRLDHEDFSKIMSTYPKLLKTIREIFEQNKSEGTYLLE